MQTDARSGTRNSCTATTSNLLHKIKCSVFAVWLQAKDIRNTRSWKSNCKIPQVESLTARSHKTQGALEVAASQNVLTCS